MVAHNAVNDCEVIEVDDNETAVEETPHCTASGDWSGTSSIPHAGENLSSEIREKLRADFVQKNIEDFLKLWTQ